MKIIGTVNRRLVFRGGRVQMEDGSSVAKYLRACGFKDGDQINIAHHQDMKDTISQVGVPLAS